MSIEKESDLQELISLGVQESTSIEYKRCAALQNTEVSKNELSKDISAFANAAGGSIIYGMVEENNLPIALDIGFEAQGPIRREWLDQVIASRIQPRIDGLVIRPIPLLGVNAGRNAFVIDIPQSHTAHQAADKRYHKRHNFTVAAMEDYEIRDVLNRAKSPLVTPTFRVRRIEQLDGSENFAIRTQLTNHGDVCARSVRIEIGIPSALVASHAVNYSEMQEIMNTRAGRNYPEVRYAFHHDGIIFPMQAVNISEWNFFGAVLNVNDDKFSTAQESGAELRWTVYADDMRRAQGQVKLFPDLISH